MYMYNSVSTVKEGLSVQAGRLAVSGLWLSDGRWARLLCLPLAACCSAVTMSLHPVPWVWFHCGNITSSFLPRARQSWFGCGELAYCVLVAGNSRWRMFWTIHNHQPVSFPPHVAANKLLRVLQWICFSCFWLAAAVINRFHSDVIWSNNKPLGKQKL